MIIICIASIWIYVVVVLFLYELLLMITYHTVTNLQLLNRLYIPIKKYSLLLLYWLFVMILLRYCTKLTYVMRVVMIDIIVVFVFIAIIVSLLLLLQVIIVLLILVVFVGYREFDSLHDYWIQTVTEYQQPITVINIICITNNML